MDSLCDGTLYLGQDRNWIHGFVNEADRQMTLDYFNDRFSGVRHVVHEMEYTGSSACEYGECENPKKKFNLFVNQQPPGTVIVWIDQRLPMYKKTEVIPFGYVGLPHYDKHRFYMAVFFYRVAGEPFIPSKTTLIPPVNGNTGTAGRLIENYNAEWGNKAPMGFVDGGNMAIVKCMPGNDYRNKTTYHGAYPKTLVDRFDAMTRGFPREKFLHLFSGSLPPSPEYIRVDAFVDGVEVKDYAHNLENHFPPNSVDLIYSDPPYSLPDLNKYEEINSAGKSEMFLDRERVLASCANVMKVGALMFWLDCVSMRHLKCSGLEVVGYISVIRSTNHRFRMVTIFEKK